MSRLDPFESIGFHCSLTFRAFTHVLEMKLKATGVSSAQFVALAHLVALGPLSQSELVSRLSITPATCARLIDRMERDGWVVRQPDPEDARINLIKPTRRVEQVWEEVSAAGRETLEQAYQGIDPDDLEIAKRVLGQIRKNLIDLHLLL